MMSRRISSSLSSVPLILIGFFLVLGVVSPSSCSMLAMAVGTPRVYTETVITTPVTDSDHWAAYDYSIRENGNISKMSYEDDTQELQPADICMPFFNHDSVQIYISSNGFLSPMPYSMCVNFCHDNSEDSDSYYKFASNLQPNGGGDWPLLGLYVHDLDPTNAVTIEAGGAIFLDKFEKEGQMVVGVEYHNVAQYDQTAAGTVAPDTTLTAQVELWPNGTIIFRYEQVLTAFHTLDNTVPSVGLIYTHDSRVISELSRAKTSDSSDPTTVTIKAIRYEPSPDPCLQYNATCGVCLANPQCRWCSSTEQCLTVANAIDICRNGDMRGNGTNCGFWPETQHNDTDANQAFYATKIRSGEPWVSINDDVNGDFGEKEYWYDRSQGTFVPITVTLPFSFSFFYNPPNKDLSSNRIVDSLWVYHQGYIGVLKEAQTCSFDQYSYCSDGKFTMTISAFAAATSFSRSVSRLVGLYLPVRNVSDPFCTPDMLNTDKLCEESYVLETDYAYASRLNQQVFTTQTIIVKGDGMLQFRYLSSIDASLITTEFTSPNATVAQLPAALSCPATSLWATWPRPTIGLVRDGVTDPSSLIIPWGNLEPGLIATMIPIPGCVDCGTHGTCNYVTRLCECESSFTGDSCSTCQTGYYGTDCLQCLACEHGGTCDEGLTGSGICECVPPYSGQTCGVLCDSDAASICSPSCYKFGGFCECGTCKCTADRGWYGNDCSQWRDPCSAMDLDGCSVCVANSDIQCNWCDTNHCFSEAGQWGQIDVNISLCTSYTTSEDSYNCPVYTRVITQNGSFALLVVVIAFVVFGISACVAVMVFCGCKRRSINILEAGALPGTPDFDPPRREREVIEVHVLPPNATRPVLGLPLKQIPLKELYDIQRGRKSPPDDSIDEE